MRKLKLVELSWVFDLTVAHHYPYNYIIVNDVIGCSVVECRQSEKDVVFEAKVANRVYSATKRVDI